MAGQLRHLHEVAQDICLQVFGGAVDPAKLPFPFRHMPAADVRDWAAIRTWAAELAGRFAEVPALA